MKRIAVVVIMALLVSVVWAQETQVPRDGTYQIIQSLGGLGNGVEFPWAPAGIIILDTVGGEVLFSWDENSNGTLSDDRSLIYPVHSYYDHVRWVMSGEIAQFWYQPSHGVYVLVISSRNSEVMLFLEAIDR